MFPPSPSPQKNHITGTREERERERILGSNSGVGREGLLLTPLEREMEVGEGRGGGERRFCVDAAMQSAGAQATARGVPNPFCQPCQ